MKCKYPVTLTPEMRFVMELRKHIQEILDIIQMKNCYLFCVSKHKVLNLIHLFNYKTWSGLHLK